MKLNVCLFVDLEYMDIFFHLTEDVVINFWKKVPLDACFRRPKIVLTNNG